MTTTPAPTASAVEWATRTVEVCGHPITVRAAGSGSPLFVLPRDNGHPPHHEFLDLLAANFRIYEPWLPGFHGSTPEEWEWLANVRDLAVVCRQLLSTLGMDRCSAVGLGFGGWLLAEMATMGPERFDAITLIGPMGIQPRREYILDQFLISTESYARSAYAEQTAFEAVYTAEPAFDQLESWETDREMTSRIAWKPYMYNPSLPGLLRGVPTPALIVHGSADRIVPLECAELYRAALPNASVELFANAGHAVELEQPAAVAATVANFMRTARS